MSGRSAVIQAAGPTVPGRYLSDFQRLERGAGGREPSWLREMRESAIHRFLAAGFPMARRGNEEWKYTNVAPLAGMEFALASEGRPVRLGRARVRQAAPWGRDWSQLVFVDGRYQPGLSTCQAGDPAATVGSLADAIAERPEAVRDWWGRLVPWDADGFTALNTAFARDGALVTVPRDRAAAQAIHLLFITTGAEAGTVSYPRVMVQLEEGGSATVVETYAGLSGARAFTDAVTEVVVGEGASLSHTKLMLEGEGAYHVASTHVRQAERSVYRSMSIAMGGVLARNTLCVALDGQGSECSLDGLYVTAGQQHVDNHTFIDHASPRTTSRELYKGVLDGASRAVFSGRILVRPEAQKTDARQSNKNLILSRGAEVDTKPFLEIFANDVQCSHGAAAGPVSEGDLFFLRARGLDERQARELLAFAFVAEVLDRILLKPVRARVENLLLRNLPTLHS